VTPARPRENPSGASALAALVAGLAAIGFSAWWWLTARYPELGHDYLSWVSAIHEGRIAWERYGTLDYAFSPFRCLGLPSFSNPSALLFSLFHLLGLWMEELQAIYAGTVLLLSFGYLGAYRLGRHLGLAPLAAVLLALGWTLQGWAASRVIVGHLPFVELVLWPWLFLVLIEPRPAKVTLLAAAFWLAHMVYSGAFYTLLIGSAGCLLALGAARTQLPSGAQACWQGRSLLRNAGVIAGLSLGMMLPKLIGVLDFLSLFPRITQLAEVPLARAFAYAAGTVAYPLPYDIAGFMGWPYGNWEATEFLFPGLLPVLAYLVYRHRQKLSVLRIAATLLGVLTISAILSSGMLRDVFSALPLLRSLHVNPRWNAVALLPLFVQACHVMATSRFLSGRGWRSASAFCAFFVLFVGTPFLHQQSAAGWGYFPYRTGIANERLSFCYEPIFGYRLEHFPRGVAGVDWLRAPLRDPRCLLASGACTPGSPLENPEEYRALQTFQMPEVNPLVRYSKVPALGLYFAGMLAMLATALELVRNAWRDLRAVSAVRPPARRPAGRR
jgi:hypothetical protein